MMPPRATDTPTHAATDVTSHGATRVGEEVPESSQPRWSGTKAFLLGWLLPSTTAQRTQNLHLRRAWLVHCTAALMAAVAIFIAIAGGNVYGQFTLTALMHVASDALGNFGDKFGQHPIRTSFAILGVVALVEAGHAVLALLMMVWGAREESLRNSYRNAIRQVWHRTAHVIPAVLVIASVGIPLTMMDRTWNAGYPVPRPEWPSPPPNAAPGSKAMTEYNKTLQEYWSLSSTWWEERNKVKPLYLVASDFLIALTVLSMITWFFWAMLRSIGASRHVKPIARPPTCETCGYNLLTIPEQSRCPECARPVLSSLGPDVRPGPIWHRRDTVGRVAAWFRCATEPILRPNEFGMRCQLSGVRVDHRRFFVLHLPPIFLTAAVALMCLVVLTEGPNGFRGRIAVILPAFLLAGYLCCIGTLGVTLLAGTLVGLHHSLREKRNLLPGAMQVASYLGGFLMIWAMFGALLILGVAALDQAEAFRSLQDRWGINPIMAMQFSLMVPNVAVGIWYLILLSRGTTATRYANK